MRKIMLYNSTSLHHSTPTCCCPSCVCHLDRCLAVLKVWWNIPFSQILLYVLKLAFQCCAFMAFSYFWLNVRTNPFQNLSFSLERWHTYISHSVHDSKNLKTPDLCRIVKYYCYRIAKYIQNCFFYTFYLCFFIASYYIRNQLFCSSLKFQASVIKESGNSWLSTHNCISYW